MYIFSSIFKEITFAYSSKKFIIRTFIFLKTVVEKIKQINPIISCNSEKLVVVTVGHNGPTRKN